MSIFGGWFSNAYDGSLRNISSYGVLSATDQRIPLPPSQRKRMMAFLWGLYKNDIFDRNSEGGNRDEINLFLGSCRVPDLVGMVNPVERIVEFYQNIFRGEWGETLKAEAEDPAILPYLDDLWKNSKMQRRKQIIQRIGPALGTVGLRVQAANDGSIVIRELDPRDIEKVDLDYDWNIISIDLAYNRMENEVPVRYEEHIDLKRFVRKRNGSVDMDVPNDLGIVPIVLISHIDNPSDPAFGLSAYHSSIPPILHICALATHIQVQVHRHVRPMWVIQGTGENPSRIKVDDTSFVMFNTAGGPDGPVKTDVQALVAKLDLAGALRILERLILEMRARQPELLVTDTDGSPRSNTSGEMVAQLRQPASDRLKLVRQNYEYGYVQASKIAMLWMQKLGMMPNIPNLEWKFEEREAIELTTDEKVKIQLAQAQMRRLDSDQVSTGEGAGTEPGGESDGEEDSGVVEGES